VGLVVLLMHFQPGTGRPTGGSGTNPEAKESLERLLAAAQIDLNWSSRRAQMADKPVPVSQPNELAPPVNREQEDVEKIASELRDVIRNGGAVLVVGHQPMLSRLADRLLRPAWRWQGRPRTPLDRSDIVCIAIDSDKRRSSWIAWVISYDDTKAAAAALRQIAPTLPGS